jgi:hypothetical protein
MSIQTIYRIVRKNISVIGFHSVTAPVAEAEGPAVLCLVEPIAGDALGDTLAPFADADVVDAAAVADESACCMGASWLDGLDPL